MFSINIYRKIAKKHQNFVKNNPEMNKLQKKKKDISKKMRKKFKKLEKHKNQKIAYVRPVEMAKKLKTKK